MFVYIVLDDDGESRSINSIYDENNFKQIYRKYLDRSGIYWSRYYDVVKLELNQDSDTNNYENVYVDDLEEV